MSALAAAPQVIDSRDGYTLTWTEVPGGSVWGIVAPGGKTSVSTHSETAVRAYRHLTGAPLCVACTGTMAGTADVDPSGATPELCVSCRYEWSE